MFEEMILNTFFYFDTETTKYFQLHSQKDLWIKHLKPSEGKIEEYMKAPIIPLILYPCQVLLP